MFVCIDVRLKQVSGCRCVACMCSTLYMCVYAYICVFICIYGLRQRRIKPAGGAGCDCRRLWRRGFCAVDADWSWASSRTGVGLCTLLMLGLVSLSRLYLVTSAASLLTECCGNQACAPRVLSTVCTDDWLTVFLPLARLTYNAS